MDGRALQESQAGLKVVLEGGDRRGIQVTVAPR